MGSGTYARQRLVTFRWLLFWGLRFSVLLFSDIALAEDAGAAGLRRQDSRELHA